MHSYVEEDTSKYISADNGLIYTPMLTKYNENNNNNNNNNKMNESDNSKDTDIEAKYAKLPYHYQQPSQTSSNNLVNSFRNELNYKLKKQRDEIDSKLGENEEQEKLNPNDNNTNTNNNNNLSVTNINPYETSSASSSTSNNDLLNSNNNLISSSTTATLKKEKPPILKPKPRNLLNYSVHYSEVPKNLVQMTNQNNNNNNKTLSSSSPSTSITDISSSNVCSPQHFDNDKYPMIPSRNDSLIKFKQRAPAPLPLASSLSASSSTVTTTFNRYITKQMNISNNEASDVNFVNNTLRRQNVVRNSDC